MNKVSHEEVFEQDSLASNNMSPLNIDKIAEFDWFLSEIDLDLIVFSDWSPKQPLSTEGMSPHPEEYFQEKYEALKSLRKTTKEENLYLEKWSDEFYARMYSNMDTKAPAIVVMLESGNYRVRSGRHRCRAAFLRGEKFILAYVGKRKS